ncbi:hypothetical protein BX600DRAFT_434349 [Xylariales sp. PMI_506]|nr:hypothetical protein BX600DRAFT_434349 [Xylariales sp. PMI_506]
MAEPWANGIPNWRRGHIVDNNTFQHLGGAHRKGVPDAVAARIPLMGLNTLQVLNNEPVVKEAMYAACCFHDFFVHNDLRGKIHVEMPMDESFFMQDERLFREICTQLWRYRQAELNGLMDVYRSSRFFVIPIRYEGHWCAIVAETCPSDDRRRDIYDGIRRYAILDPLRTLLALETKTRIQRQFLHLMRTAGFEFLDCSLQHIHLPIQDAAKTHAYESGFRVYHAIKHMLEMFQSKSLAADMEDQRALDKQLWDYHRYFVDPQKVRAEMTGHCAWWCNYTYGFSTRTAIECIKWDYHDNIPAFALAPTMYEDYNEDCDDITEYSDEDRDYGGGSTTMRSAHTVSYAPGWGVPEATMEAGEINLRGGQGKRPPAPKSRRIDSESSDDYAHIPDDSSTEDDESMEEHNGQASDGGQESSDQDEDEDQDEDDDETRDKDGDIKIGNNEPQSDGSSPIPFNSLTLDSPPRAPNAPPNREDRPLNRLMPVYEGRIPVSSSMPQGYQRFAGACALHMLQGGPGRFAPDEATLARRRDRCAMAAASHAREQAARDESVRAALRGVSGTPGVPLRRKRARYFEREGLQEALMRIAGGIMDAYGVPVQNDGSGRGR